MSSQPASKAPVRLTGEALPACLRDVSVPPRGLWCLGDVKVLGLCAQQAVAIVGTRDPVVVEFPWSLDEGLLHRALGVTTADGTVIDGAIAISDDERRWTFTPARTWEAVAHSLVVLTLLEDPAGNRVGEPFEFEMFGTPVPDAERVTLPIPKR